MKPANCTVSHSFGSLARASLLACMLALVFVPPVINFQFAADGHAAGLRSGAEGFAPAKPSPVRSHTLGSLVLPSQVRVSVTSFDLETLRDPSVFSDWDEGARPAQR